MGDKSGISYFIQGWHLVSQPGLKKFVFLPMLANIVIMSLLFYWLFSSLSSVIDLGLNYVPSWLQWLGYIASFLVIVTFAIFFCYFFSLVTNIIAAPFNGLLAEQVEALLTHQPPPDSSIISVIQDVPRILKREWLKLANYLLWTVPILLTSFIPVFGQLVTPIIWFIFTAWMVNLQYADYAFDNHKVNFYQTRQLLKQDKVDNVIFGALVSLFTMIPLLNLIIMPVAVCGATAMWVDRYRANVIASESVSSLVTAWGRTKKG